ncbi:internalin A [Providencia alcalifaciens]|nr:internalin A [Providencia alcalifaciens]
MSNIKFIDINLELAVKETLNLNTTENVTTENILLLKSLIVVSKGIFSLSGLEYAVNLEKVTFTDNNIISLKPLRDLKKLFSIGVAANINLPIDEILRFKKITELDLSLNNQMIDDIKELSNLTELTTLWINDTPLSDVSFLSSLNKLIYLQLNNNNIQSLSPLNSNELIGLWCRANNITTFSDVKNLGKIQRIMASDNNLVDLKFVSSMKHLTHLYVDANKLTTLHDINNKTLTYINAAYNNLTSLDIGDAPSLVTLLVPHNTIKDIDNVSSIPALATLDLTQNKLVDISNLRKLKNLSVLYTRENPNISKYFLLSHTSMMQLIANNGGLNDERIQTLGQSDTLILLGVASSNLTDISFMKNFSSVKVLSLDSNSITDLTPLSTFSLQTLSCKFQKITLPDIKKGESTSLRLFNIAGVIPSIIFNTPGKLTDSLLAWDNSGSNSLTFADKLPIGEFDGEVKQLVTI